MQSPVKNEAYVLVGKSIYYKNLLSELAIFLGKKPPKRKAPRWLLAFFSKLDWLWCMVFRRKRSLLKATVRSLYRISFYDTSKVEKELDFSFTPYKETLSRVAKNYLKRT
jgi:hypothetical protein